GELEVVRGEQREGTHARGDVARHRQGERQPVEGTGAAADLIEENETARGGVVQVVGGPGHLHHEGGAPAGEIIRRSDAREDAIDRPEHGALRGHVAAHVREQRDERRLAHILRRPANVRSGDDDHAQLHYDRQVLGYERTLREALDHRVAPALDREARLRGQLRTGPLEHAGPLRESGQGVELGERAGGGLQRTQGVDEPRQNLLVQLLLARQRLIARPQHPLLEALQLLGDEALGGLHGLATHVVLRRTLGIAARDFDEEALHAVVAELERGEPRALAFAPLQLEEELIGVGGGAPQLIELGVVAGGDHLAVAHQCGGLGGDGGSEQSHHVLVLVHASAQLLEERRIERHERGAQRRHGGERAAQQREVAPPRRAQCHPRENALDIAHALQVAAHAVESARLDQGADRVVALAQQRVSGQWAVEPASQLPRAHGGGAAVDHREQRRVLTSAETRIEL